MEIPYIEWNDKANQWHSLKFMAPILYDIACQDMFCSVIQIYCTYIYVNMWFEFVWCQHNICMPGKCTYIQKPIKSAWTPVASFTKEVNPRLAKCPLKTNGRLANRGLTSLVKEATKV